MPEDGLVQYTIDMTYSTTATLSLDVAQFVDTPSLVCADTVMGQSCADWGDCQRR
ncbi:MAG: hypothetical protein R2911_28775 [Caldilineaceae bacterium]